MVCILGKFTLRFYVTLWITAVGGLLGANIAGMIGTLFFVEENKIEFVRPWWHGGWYVGTLLFFVGAVLGKLKMIQGTSPGGFRTKKEGAFRLSHVGSSDKFQKANSRDSAHGIPLKRRVRGVLKSFFVGGLAGGFLGVLIGGSLLVFWLSVAYSPFAPKIRSTARSNQQTNENPREQRPLRQPGTRLTIRSGDRMSLYICLVPTTIGAITGAFGLGILSTIYPEEPQVETDLKNE